MHKYLLHAAYGWLTLTGVMHFVIDVVSQHLRGKHVPGTETTLYYGVHSAFALGQTVFGLLGLWLTFRARDVLSELPVVLLSLIATVGWLAVAVLFMEYWQPRFNAVFFGLLIVAGALTRP
ncbi:hypothetical protein [Chondromyces crocatus]|uniref:Membrane protein n=1 Tax=Chondromyces crocatus TaxID=52 RepID=A0A0K1ECC2_CHOCO|nr:hypothetical protein [Chondromyces crocatus]AKT38520.1 membrane protein [Chondromyces crocatus]